VRQRLSTLCRFLIGAAILSAMSLPATAGAGAHYSCKTQHALKVTRAGAKEQIAQSFTFEWHSNGLIFSELRPLSDAKRRQFPISFQNKTYVVSRNAWGTINFNDRSGVMTIFVPRMDIGYLFWARCVRI